MNIEEAIKILKDNIESLEGHKPFKHTNNEKVQAIETLLTAYEKEKEERERIGKLYYEANENCIKYEKFIKKIEEILEKYKYTEIGNSGKIIEFYNELKGRIKQC